MSFSELGEFSGSEHIGIDRNDSASDNHHSSGSIWDDLSDFLTPKSKDPKKWSKRFALQKYGIADNDEYCIPSSSSEDSSDSETGGNNKSDESEHGKGDDGLEYVKDNEDEVDGRIIGEEVEQVQQNEAKEQIVISSKAPLSAEEIQNNEIKASLLENLPLSGKNVSKKCKTKSKAKQKEEKNEEEDSTTRWDDRETKFLLQILKVCKVNKLLDNTSLPRRGVYEKVSKILKKQGNVAKTTKQIQTKWRSLTKAYNVAKASLRPSGAGTKGKKSCKFFEELDEILGDRPAQKFKGVESKTFEEEEVTSEEVNGDDSVSQRKRDKPASSDSEADVTLPDSLISEPEKSFTVEDNAPKKKSSKHISKKSKQEIMEDVMNDAVHNFQKNDENRDLINHQRLVEFQSQRDENVLKKFEEIQKNTTNQLLSGLEKIFGKSEAVHDANCSTQQSNPNVLRESSTNTVPMAASKSAPGWPVTCGPNGLNAPNIRPQNYQYQQYPFNGYYPPY